MDGTGDKRNDTRQAVGEDCNDNASYHGSKNAFPEPSLFCTLLSECFGCVIGSFFGTVLVKILLQLL